MVERATKKIKVKLVDNSEVELLLYENVGYATAQRLKAKLLKDVSISEKKAKSGDIEIPADRSQELMIDVLEAVWADKNYVIDDVKFESLGEIAEELMSCFLEGTGLQPEIGDNKSS